MASLNTFAIAHYFSSIHHMMSVICLFWLVKREELAKDFQWSVFQKLLLLDVAVNKIRS